jgi:hypothetical protein
MLGMHLLTPDDKQRVIQVSCNDKALVASSYDEQWLQLTHCELLSRCQM